MSAEVTVDTTALQAPAKGRGSVLAGILRSPSGLIGLLLTGAVVTLGLLSVFNLLPFDPIAQRPEVRLQGPSGEHWFGTDQFGRDILSRTASGVANSLLISVVAVAFAAIIGTAGGLIAGFFRGWSDRSISGVTNVLFAFPPLLLALSLASAFDRTWFTIAVAIAIVYAPIFVRVARGPVLSLREADFVRSATVVGMRRFAIIWQHILPNIGAIVIVQITLSLSWAVLTEASLSFLGLGTPPPAASLGAMIFEARTLVNFAPWTMFAPGAVIILLVVGLNLLGDGLRDALDPRNRGTK
ncbi:ABC transporter permease [Ruicaihuangia caeni]|uniref:ABC transporter permease n=1 Tax=Ruicaihuangia caeni TaxID=3042517 RepID=A0AAW6TA77_9MICO|nr:ABC transporter permease [Klugiella sp. YN-L-19]MDI2098673.1 ABC transporter permease [Klugiella sp. YN-L-19]